MTECLQILWRALKLGCAIKRTDGVLSKWIHDLRFLRRRHDHRTGNRIVLWASHSIHFSDLL